MTRIVLIHAVEVAMKPISNAFAAAWPEAERVNILEDALSPDRALDEHLTPEMTERIADLGNYAAKIGASGILYTCSAFGAAIEEVARALPIPVLKPNEGMFEAALKAGNRIGMLATFGPSVAGMETEFRDVAEAAGRDAKIETILVESALDALKSGDAETHNRLVAEAAPRLAHCDAVMLAHFSTSNARAAVEATIDIPVLTSPDCAVEALQRRVERLG